MIQHLCEKTVIKMTTLQKYNYKNECYCKPWDPTTSITAYFTGLNKIQISLDNHSILTSVKEKMIATGVRIWESEMFTKEQMVGWENKPAVDQTWVNLQTSQKSGLNAANFSSNSKTLPIQGGSIGSARAGGHQGRW
jgi:hypothetical protein